MPVPAGAIDLATGNPDPELLAPLARALQRVDARPHLYAEQHELPTLREILANAFEAVGIAAEHLAVVSGALDGIERVVLAQLRPGDRIGVEDPDFSECSISSRRSGSRRCPWRSTIAAFCQLRSKQHSKRTSQG